MMGIDGPEALVLLLIVLFVVGPNRLPELAGQLARFGRKAREFFDNARAEVKRQADIDLAGLDPRQYDPRVIVRDAFREAGSGPKPPAARRATPGQAPFDNEAT